MFDGKAVVVTGGANGFGKCIAQEFEKLGAHVCVMDKRARMNPLEFRRVRFCRGEDWMQVQGNHLEAGNDLC